MLVSENAAIAGARSAGSGRGSHSYQCMGTEGLAQAGLVAFVAV